MGGLRYLFYTKDIFCKHKIERDALPPVSRGWVKPDEKGIQMQEDSVRGRRRKGQCGSELTVVRQDPSRYNRMIHFKLDLYGLDVASTRMIPKPLG